MVEYYLGTKKQREQSSMLLAFLADWSVILNSKEAYNDLHKVLELFDNILNLQIWFPKKETEDIYLDKSYSLKSGKVKHSIMLYESIEGYKKEIQEELELFSAEREFIVVKSGFDFILSISSLHHRDLPFPFLWRRLIKTE